MALFSYLRYVHFVQKFPAFGQRGTGLILSALYHNAEL